MRNCFNLLLFSFLLLLQIFFLLMLGITFEDFLQNSILYKATMLGDQSTLDLICCYIFIYTIYFFLIYPSITITRVAKQTYAESFVLWSNKIQHLNSCQWKIKLLKWWSTKILFIDAENGPSENICFHLKSIIIIEVIILQKYILING